MLADKMRMVGAAEVANITDLSYVTALQDTVGRTTYTFTAASIGTADTEREVFVVIQVSKGSLSNRSISSATIGGVAATIATQQLTSNSYNAAFFCIRAKVPTGTTGDIAINLSGGVANCYAAVYRVVRTGGVSIENDTATAVGLSGTSVSIGTNVTIQPKGIASAVGGITNPGSTVSATNYNKDNELINVNLRRAASSFSNIAGGSATSPSLTYSWTSSTSSGLVGWSFS